MNKIITRIKGGLGNQLFCYAAARRLAIVNNADLVIDDITGFVRDSSYRRRYMLDHFSIPARKALPAERMEPFERYRRGVLKWLSHRKPFQERRYIEQEGLDFDERLLSLKVNGTLYIDGYWQSENYFKDIEQTIRAELLILPPEDALNRQMAWEIKRSLSVAVHMRWFDVPGSTEAHNVSTDYYQRAIALMEKRLPSPRYFVFSDDQTATLAKLSLPAGRATFISHNRGDENAYADLWLMTQCRHFITANSTFSWWGAWLAQEKEKFVVTPNVKIDGITAWNFRGLIPMEWIRL